MALITDEQKALFHSQGYVIVPGFYDLEGEIYPVLEGIHGVIDRVARRHGVPVHESAFTPESFDANYDILLKADRAYAGEVYDLVKQIPAFLRLICNQRAEDLFREIRGACMPGIGAASYGIRIDNPNEDKFRSHWHQEFMFQPQSIDGIVFWTPLLPITPDLGPVIVLPKSHADGLCVYARTANYADKQGAYQIGIHDEDRVVGKHQQIAPLTKPGDLLLMDFLTIHSSGVNRSHRARWSVQNRFFNFDDAVGYKIGWKPSVTVGTRVEDVFPDHFVDASQGLN